jgi:hypothetical protein
MVLVGKPEEKGPLEKLAVYMGDNIKIELQEVGCKSMYRIYLAQDMDRWRALAYAAMHIRFP